MQAQTFGNAGQTRLFQQSLRLGPAHAHGVFHRTFKKITDKQQHDEIEQKRRHHLVHAQPGFQQSRTQQHKRARQHGKHRRHRQHKGRWNRPGAQEHRHDGSGIKLRLGADVPQLGFEGHSNSQTGKDQRRCPVQRFKKRKLRPNRPSDDLTQNRKRIGPSQQRQQARNNDRRHQRGSGQTQPAGKCRVRDRLKPHGRLP